MGSKMALLEYSSIMSCKVTGYKLQIWALCSLNWMINTTRKDISIIMRGHSQFLGSCRISRMCGQLVLGTLSMRHIECNNSTVTCINWRGSPYLNKQSEPYGRYGFQPQNERDPLDSYIRVNNMNITRVSTSMRAWCPSIFANCSNVARIHNTDQRSTLSDRQLTIEIKHVLHDSMDKDYANE